MTLPKLSDAVKAISRVMGPPLAEIQFRAMKLRKAGMISKAGRGLHAADMTARDIMTLVLAVLAGGMTTQSALTTAHVGEADAGNYRNRIDDPEYPADPNFLPFLDQLPDGHKLIDALTLLLELMRKDELVFASIGIAVRETPVSYGAEIVLTPVPGGKYRDFSIDYGIPRSDFASGDESNYQEKARKLIDKNGRMETTRSINWQVLEELAHFLNAGSVHE